ncbi:MAG: hypothetical protein ABS882_13850, partial [Lysinibacillus sp.]
NRKRTLQWKPALMSIAIVAALLLLVFSSSKGEPIQTSSTLAPFDADIVLVDRFQQFQSIVADGVITEQERREYISRSDWDLQLAFESGSSIFFNRPAMATEDIKQVNELLFYMYRIVYDQVVVEQFHLTKSEPNFETILQLAPSFNKEAKAFVSDTYTSSLQEKPFTKNAFLNLHIGWQLFILMLFTLFLYLFIQNIRIDRKKFAGVLQLLFIVIIGSFFVIKDTKLYSYNETALMESAHAHVTEIDSKASVKDLLAIAQYDEGRVALFELQDERLMLMDYVESNGDYKFQGSSIQYGSDTHVFGLSESYEWQYIVGVKDTAKFSAVSMFDNILKEEYKIPIVPRIKLYLLVTPEQSRSKYLNWYDASGKRIE